MFCLRKLTYSVLNQTYLQLNEKPLPKVMKLLIRCLSHKLEIQQALLNYKNNGNLRWDEIYTDVSNSFPNQNINSAILQGCHAHKMIDEGLLFFRYLISSGKNLSDIEYTFVIKMLTDSVEHLKKNTDIVFMLYNKMKTFIGNSSMMNKNYFFVFGHVECLAKELWAEFGDKEAPGKTYLAAGAFERNDYKQGFEIINRTDNWGEFNEVIIKSYLRYCLRLAKENKFTPHLIDLLVDHCQTSGSIIPFHNFFVGLQKLTDCLNLSKSNYMWSVHKTKIINNVCSCCNFKLKETSFTDEEWNILKNSFLNDVLINKNVFLKTSHSELDNFLDFLHKSPKYDIVVDGLNATPTSGKLESLCNMITHFKNKKKKMLFIGRHFWKKSGRYDFIYKHCTVFLVSELSDDDVFVMYAAIHGGPRTYFITNDFYRGYSNLIKDVRGKYLFHKWHLSHRLYCLKQRWEKSSHGMLSQITQHGDNLVYHMSYGSNPYPNFSKIKNAKWLCLKAIRFKQ